MGIHVMHPYVVMAADGRLVIPADVRSQLGMQEGGNFILHVEGGQVHLVPIRAAVACAQAMVRRYVPEGISLVDELSEGRQSAAGLE
ncbi:AbrB/MazE/SpoVT family DNA-binding domain-containing protein [Skermanella mucosa]|uniref:AbrB/MazE/SpoVT family DNA-binding domain-containing protein n=1 Tax=Skermanella mucosa TaxID=1789672 RepID=UPI00192AB681|nr:AbrB/MazE/SpoVT family DNA-binding domain-containing protein [Skermanella mucosa]UEM20127.1 AbrB/MazE/SpoVT family DNA-binding domain-containing protein [Skermanella mucosa]